MAKHEQWIGSVRGVGVNKTSAAADAITRAAGALRAMEGSMPLVVAWRGSACMVYARLESTDGKLLWCYTNPRTLDELSADQGRLRMGWAGYYDSSSMAASAALSHLIQNDERGIPADLPDSLHPKDRANLESMRERLALVA